MLLQKTPSEWLNQWTIRTPAKWGGDAHLRSSSSSGVHRYKSGSNSSNIHWRLHSQRHGLPWRFTEDSSDHEATPGDRPANPLLLRSNCNKIKIEKNLIKIRLKFKYSITEIICLVKMGYCKSKVSFFLIFSFFKKFAWGWILNLEGYFKLSDLGDRHSFYELQYHNYQSNLSALMIKITYDA